MICFNKCPSQNLNVKKNKLVNAINVKQHYICYLDPKTSFKIALEVFGVDRPELAGDESTAETGVGANIDIVGDKGAEDIKICGL